MGVLYNRLYDWVNRNNILNEYQAGFRKQYSTTDNFYNLYSILHLKKLAEKYVYGFFVDFKAAFDTIHRKALFYKLSNMGVSTKFVTVLKHLYTNTSAKVYFNGMVSEEFGMEMGVKQGCLLSPLLSSLMLNDMHDVLGGGVTSNI